MFVSFEISDVKDKWTQSNGRHKQGGSIVDRAFFGVMIEGGWRFGRCRSSFSFAVSTDQKQRGLPLQQVDNTFPMHIAVRDSFTSISWRLCLES